jgi:hypothetical protein
MTDELRDHLRNIIEDAIERGEDHLDWLARAWKMKRTFCFIVGLVRSFSS